MTEPYSTNSELEKNYPAALLPLHIIVESVNPAYINTFDLPRCLILDEDVIPPYNTDGVVIEMIVTYEDDIRPQ